MIKLLLSSFVYKNRNFSEMTYKNKYLYRKIRGRTGGREGNSAGSFAISSLMKSDDERAAENIGT